jgi:hypothetical protein
VIFLDGKIMVVRVGDLSVEDRSHDHEYVTYDSPYPIVVRGIRDHRVNLSGRIVEYIDDSGSPFLKNEGLTEKDFVDAAKRVLEEIKKK